MAAYPTQEQLSTFATSDGARKLGQAFQTGAGTLVAGVLTVSTGITVTSASRIYMARVTAAGTSGDELRCPAADRTVGGPGTGSITIRSFLSAVAATSDTSTIEYMIVG